MLVHTVLFYAKPGATPAQIKQLKEDAQTLLSQIPTVRQIWTGNPAKTDPRPVIDMSYAVGLTVIFDDLAAHNVYQTHELHLKFIARNKETWQRVQVYDFD